jgi:ribonuclease HI
MILAEQNNIQLQWVPGHKEIKGNAIDDQLAKRVSLHPFIRPKPTCGVSDRVSGQVITD